MAEKPALTQMLKANAGLSDQSASVYKYILMVGSLTVGEVCEYTGFDYQTASKALKELTEGKLIRKLTHVVERYVAVAPYKAFAERLVEFQRTMKQVEENARKTTESTLAEISRVNEEWKKSANKMKEDQVSQAKREIATLKDEAENTRSSLMEKLKQETETKKTSVSEMLKSHMDEHASRVTETKKDIAVRMDNSVAKFDEVATKLKEEATQTTSRYITSLDVKIQLFIKAVKDNLTVFQSGFSSLIEDLQGETSTFLDDSSSKIDQLVADVKTGADKLMREADQSYLQLLTQLKRTISENVESTTGAVSTENNQLQSDLANGLRIYGEKAAESIDNFQKKTREAIEGWKSLHRDELGNRFTALKEVTDKHLEDLGQKLELTREQMPETLNAYSTSAIRVSGEFSSNISVMIDSLKNDFFSGTTPVGDELQRSCDAVGKDCSSLASVMESLSKKNVPLASKAISDFTSDLSSRLSKTMARAVENAKSYAQEAKQDVLKAISTAEKGRQLSGDGTARAETLKKEISGMIDDAVKTYIEGAKKNVEDLEKLTSERISSIAKFEEELEKKWGSITPILGRIADLADSIRSFPQRIGKVTSELVKQYGKKADSAVSSMKRMLNVHSTQLGDAVTNTLKKWNATLEKTKKELGDLSSRRQRELEELFSQHISAAEKITDDRIKELADLVFTRIEAFKAENSNAQANISKYVASNMDKSRTSFKNLESNLKNALDSSGVSFKTVVESKCTENEQLSATIIDQITKTTTSLKERFESIAKEGKEQIKQVCEDTVSRLSESASESSKELHDIVSSLTGSFNGIVDTANESYRNECVTTKTIVVNLLSQHLKDYTEAVNKVINEVNLMLSEHFEDCNQVTSEFNRKLGEMLTSHQNKFEESSSKMVAELTNCIDRDETTVKGNSNRMLKEFTDNTTKVGKEANSIETVMRTAWVEITDTQQINADKTWHYVTKQAILNHLKDMVRRSKSTVTIVVPTLEEAPLDEIKAISKAIRINIVAGVDETLQKKLLQDLLTQGNIRIWSLTEKAYISCTRDAEEVLVAPVARKDTDCVATVSVEENYVKLYHKFIGPMWMASSREIKERALR
ncbi:MAG: helix-turn-helix domain-containing protein [Candidatus Atabeyarchaeum deiterrae]